MNEKIRYLKHHEIDKEKWDRAVHSSTSGVFYGLSWVLDCTAKKWNALIVGDYEVLLPIPVKKKWGITYGFQPLFTQYLPIITKENITTATIDLLLKKIKKHLRWVHINLPIKISADKNILCLPRTNYFLPIPNSVSELTYRHNKDFRKNIRKATGCKIVSVTDPALIATYYFNTYGNKYIPRPQEYQFSLQQLITTAMKKNCCKGYGVTDEKGNLVFTSAMFFFKNKAIYIVGAPSTLGRAKSVTHFFIDQFIEQHIGMNMIFDFEGSSIPSVAAFYQKFLPSKELYYEIKINNLPFPLNLFKR